MSAMIKLFLGPLKKWAYSDFMQKTAKPTRRAWVRIMEAHMESLINGVQDTSGILVYRITEQLISMQ